MNTHNLKLDFGRYYGELYTRVHVSYLKWMVQCNHHCSNIAESELKRRGTTTPEIDISGHAIDQASLRILSKWKIDCDMKIGFYSWLCKVAKHAYDKHLDKNNIAIYKNIKFVFELGKYPVLKTCMPYNKKNKNYNG